MIDINIDGTWYQVVDQVADRMSEYDRSVKHAVITLERIMEAANKYRQAVDAYAKNNGYEERKQMVIAGAVLDASMVEIVECTPKKKAA